VSALDSAERNLTRNASILSCDDVVPHDLGSPSFLEQAVGGEDGLHQAVDYVIDMPGDRYARGDGV
jgi:hypothetical protein